MSEKKKPGFETLAKASLATQEQMLAVKKREEFICHWTSERKSRCKRIALR
jgi:hypothetical protein